MRDLEAARFLGIFLGVGYAFAWLPVGLAIVITLVAMIAAWRLAERSRAAWIVLVALDFWFARSALAPA